MYQLIDGKKIARELIQKITERIRTEMLEPQLAVILVGHDPASELYVKLKEKHCREAGITIHIYRIPESEDEFTLHKTIQFLNNDPEIDAILIQLPLPESFDQDRAIALMDYRKDVDGFHPTNIHSYLDGKPQIILPGLSLAIWHLIESTGEKQYHDKHALIVAKSERFTQPTKKLLEERGMTVAIAKPDENELTQKMRDAEILITAIGKPQLITSDMVREGATVIDVGINTLHGITVGDVDFASVAPKTAFITPVPGGVGPMTVAMLLLNTTILARMRRGSHAIV